MKKLVAIVAFFMIVFQSNAQDKIIQFVNLPQNAQQFIRSYYNLKDVAYIKLDKDFMSTSYEVKFNDGGEVEFDANGNWKEVDGKKKAVPNSIIPIDIKNYVKKSFPNNEIVQISRDGRKYEVELTNGLDLVFNKKGEFIRLDD